MEKSHGTMMSMRLTPRFFKLLHDHAGKPEPKREWHIRVLGNDDEEFTISGSSTEIRQLMTLLNTAVERIEKKEQPVKR